MRYGRWFILAWFLCFDCLAAPLPCSQLPQLRQIGSAPLSVWGFSVYTARTLSCAGEPLVDFSSLPKPFALQLTYKRDIARDNLIDTTREQWQRLALYSDEAEFWLAQLSTFWPSVHEGDELTLFVRIDGASEFYLDDQLIGQITDARFGQSFLAIWLHADASYPKVRKKLLGDAS